MKIFYDIDGVVADFESAFDEFLFSNFGLIRKNTNKHHIEVDGLTNNQVMNIVEEVLKRYNDIYPFKTSLEYFKNKKEKINFLTARKDYLNEYTHKWFKKWLPNLKYNLYNAKSSDKPKFVFDNNGDILVEDRFRTCIEASKILNYVFMINRRSNIGRKFDEPNIIRIDHLSQIDNFLKGE